MGKIIMLSLMILTLMILFNITGMTTDNSSYVGTSLNMTTAEGIASYQNFDLFELFKQYAGALLGAGVIFAGTLLARGSPELAGSAALGTGLLIGFIGDLVSVVTLGAASGIVWIQWFVILFGAGLVFAYIISLWDWIRGVNP